MSRLLDAVRLLGRTWRPVFVYLVVAGGLTGLVLAPVATWLLTRGLALTGVGAVLNYAIADLALSLPGLLLAVLWALGVALLVVFFTGGPVLLTTAARTGRPTTARAVLMHVIRALRRVPGVGALKLALLAALIFPLVTAGAAALVAIALIPFGGDPLEALVSADLAAVTPVVVAVAALALVGFVFYVRWCFAYHVLLVEGTTLGEALKRSVALNRGAFSETAKALLLHQVTQALLLAAASLVLGLFQWLALEAFDPEGGVFALGVAALLVLHGIGLGIVFLIGVGRETALLTNLYFERESRAETYARKVFDWDVDDPRNVEVVRGRAKRFLLLAAALFAVAVAVTVPAVTNEFERAARPVGITAHRGSSAEAPENTMAAFRLAIEDGANWTELDVYQAKDGTLAVLHDANLKRLAGVDKAIYEMTKEELDELEVGSHFDERFRGERIPTLGEVIRLAKGRMRLNIELKTHGHEKGFEASVVALLHEEGFGDDCVITSLDQAALAAVRREDPGLRIGMIISAKVGDLAALDVDFYSVLSAVATGPFIRRAHRQGREVHVWTINERAAMTRMIDRGADNLITDHPKTARAVVNARDLGDEVAAVLTRLFRN